MLLLKSRIIIISSFKEHINTFISFSQRKKLVNIKKCVKHIEFVYTAAEEQSKTKKFKYYSCRFFSLRIFVCAQSPVYFWVVFGNLFNYSDLYSIITLMTITDPRSDNPHVFF